MFTKWFKNCLKAAIAGAGGGSAFDLPVKGVGNVMYYAGYIGYPYSAVTTFVLNATARGIHVGTGDTPATEDDYCMESPITAGLAGTVTITKSIDANGCPFVTYNVVLSNSTASDIVVKEVGFIQSEYLGNTAAATSLTDRYVLIDRTVLDTPVTVPANGNAAIYYTLKTSYDFES